jgi:hypothetical protein
MAPVVDRFVAAIRRDEPLAPNFPRIVMQRLSQTGSDCSRPHLSAGGCRRENCRWAQRYTSHAIDAAVKASPPPSSAGRTRLSLRVRISVGNQAKTLIAARIRLAIPVGSGFA